MSTTAEGTRIVLGTCHHDCPDSCGWQVTVRDGAAVQLRGNPDHPFSRGELCPKVNRFLDRVHSPDRILHPLRRTGPKGDGQFEPISWDDALDEIAARLHEAIDAHGAETVLPYSDAGNQSVLAMFFPERFWNRLGGSQLLRAICGNVAGAGTRATNGTAESLDPSELRHAQLILLWGTNTRLTNRHLWPVIEAARADGAQVVVIDPIRTLTADAADWFVQPRPGTDVALMLAMIHVLVRDGLIDDEWVADAHDRLRRPRRPRRRVDAGASRGDHRRRRRRDRAPGHGLRHDPPGGHPHPDRRRAPRERGDVLPHARLPAGARRRVARPRRRAVPLDRHVERPVPRPRRAHPSRPAERADRRGC